MKFLLVIGFLLSTTYTYAQGQKVPIAIKLTDVPKNGKIYLSNGQRNFDSSDLANGTAIFTWIKETAEPESIAIATEGQKRYFALWVEATPITITGSFNDFNKLEFRGSTTQADFVRYQSMTKPYFDSVNKIKYMLSGSRAGKKADTLQLLMEVARLEKPLKAIKTDFILAHPNSYISAISLAFDHRSRFFTNEEAFSLFSSLSKENQNTQHGQAILESIRLYNRPQLGDLAPIFQMKDLNGKMVNTAVISGKPVLILFGASWCGPCRVEAPFYKEVYNKYKGKGFQVIAVSLDEKKEAWAKYVNDINAGWISVSDLKGWQNDAALRFGVSKVPDSYLLNDKGVVIGIDVLWKELDTALSSFYNK